MDKQKATAAFGRLLDIMDDLREKCPWDKKQNIHTLRNLSIEETYELVDAITENDFKGIKEEIGDLMLHMVSYAKIGDEQKQFDMTDALNGICDKLIHRHPHIYGDQKVADAEEVLVNWEKLKLQEGKKSVLEGVPKSLPSMVKAYRIQEKVKQVGFEWETKEQVWEKVEEEIAELKEAIEAKDQINIEKEFGDVMFSMINYSRFLKVEPESALELTNKKFIKRFQKMESEAVGNGKSLKDMTLEEMDEIWNKIKPFIQ